MGTLGPTEWYNGYWRPRRGKWEASEGSGIMYTIWVIGTLKA